jgi:hypothetical protein
VDSDDVWVYAPDAPSTAAPHKTHLVKLIPQVDTHKLPPVLIQQLQRAAHALERGTSPEVAQATAQGPTLMETLSPLQLFRDRPPSSAPVVDEAMTASSGVPVEGFGVGDGGRHWPAPPSPARPAQRSVFKVPAVPQPGRLDRWGPDGARDQARAWQPADVVVNGMN